MKEWSKRDKTIAMIAIVLFVVIIICGIAYLNNTAKDTRENAKRIIEEQEYIQDKSEKTTEEIINRIKNNE